MFCNHPCKRSWSCRGCSNYDYLIVVSQWHYQCITLSHRIDTACSFMVRICMQENLHGYESWCFASKKGTHSISGAYLLWWIFMIVYPKFRQNLASIAWSIWREHARTNEPNIKSLLSCIEPRNIRNGPTHCNTIWHCSCLILLIILSVRCGSCPFPISVERRTWCCHLSPSCDKSTLNLHGLLGCFCMNQFREWRVHM